MKDKKFEKLMNRLRKSGDPDQVRLTIRDDAMELDTDQFERLKELHDELSQPPLNEDNSTLYTIIVQLGGEDTVSLTGVRAKNLKDLVKNRLAPVIRSKLGWDTSEVSVPHIFKHPMGVAELKDLESNEVRDWWVNS